MAKLRIKQKTPHLWTPKFSADKDLVEIQPGSPQWSTKYTQVGTLCNF